MNPPTPADLLKAESAQVVEQLRYANRMRLYLNLIMVGVIVSICVIAVVAAGYICT